MIEDVIKKIKAADMVLVGIGEKLDFSGCIEKEQYYQELAALINKPESTWMLPFVKKIMLDKLEKEKSYIYEALADCIGQKNYFIVSLCQDGLLRKSRLDKERIVEPCGSYVSLQCSKKCNTELYSVPDGLLDQIGSFLESRGGDERPQEPLCPECGSALVFNNVNAAAYAEEGYLENWQRYKKWLQGTVNKNLCVLELGVGMKYPTVIRWPFEKVVFFNQKAELFRVHDTLFQVAEEIKDRACGICQKPDEFLVELSQGF